MKHLERLLKNYYWARALAGILALVLVGWLVVFASKAEHLQRDFKYEAEVISTDNLYDSARQRYSGQQQSVTKLSYEAVDRQGSTLAISNTFAVSSLTGEPIFSVERQYGIDAASGQHVAGYGDHDREGYLFAPRGATKSDYLYWHVNYDVPISMKFSGEDTILGLPVYKYQSDFTADQSKELSNLPDVPEKRGISLDVNLQLWIEPATGWLIKYQDQATAYYYDRASGQRVEPWNRFSNHTSEGSVAQQVAYVKSSKRQQWIAQVGVPLSLSFLILALVFAPKGSRLLRSPALPWVVLVVMLLLTAMLYHASQSRIRENALADFESRATGVHDAIAGRLLDYEQVLYGGQGLFAANGGKISRDQWHSYADKLNIKSQLPGLQGIGFSLKIGGADELTQHIKQIRAEGFPGYTVTPAGPRDEYHAIIYLEPFDERNQRAFGFDMFQEPVRRSAMALARDSGELTISGKVRPVQETDIDVQAGFLMYVPVYRLGATTTTADEKRSALVGFVYSPFRAKDFINGLFGSQTASGLNLKIYDQTLDQSNLLYDSQEGTADSSPGLFAKQLTLQLPGDRQWQLSLSSTPQIEAAIDTFTPLLAAGAGLLTSLLLFGLLYSLQTARTRAFRLADKMTHDLRQSEASALASVRRSATAEASAAAASLALQKQNQQLEDTKRAVLNILEDLEAEKNKLSEVTQKDEALVSSIGESIVVSDEYGRITRANPAVQILLGYTESELRGKAVLAAIPAKTLDGLPVPPENQAIFEALATGKPAHASYSLERKDHSTIIASVTASPYLIGDRPAGVVIIIRDISQQAAVDKAKTEFVSLASHQLRTPLSTINWYLEMILGGDTGKVTEEQKQYLSEVYAANQRMVVLVNSLLNVSRIDLGTFAIEPEPTDLKKTVQNVLAEMKEPIDKKQHKIITNFDDKVGLYKADPKLMHIIFQNLISNSVKYTQEKGTITISIAPVGSKLVIEESDNGYGIPKAQQFKVFTKLFRADNVVAKDTDGTGLGLYMIKAIIEEAGGTIKFVSEENKGTTFTIELPLAGMKKRVGTKGLTTAPVV